MRSVRAFLLLLCCSGCWCQYCNTTRAYFESRNFYSLLRWDKIEIPGREVRYSVGYSEYGSQLVPLTECQNITEPSCDFSYVFKRFRSRHFAKIMVDGKCVGQYVGFVPLEETILEAPKVSVIPRDSSITVTLTEPMGPRNRSISEFLCWETCKESETPSVNYIVRLTHPDSECGKKYQNMAGTVTINHLQANTEYCGEALYQLAHPATLKLSERAAFCVTLPGKTLGLWIYFVILGPVALVMIVLGLVMCQLYLKRKRELPKVLTHITSKSNSPNVQAFPDPKMDVLSVCAEAPRNLVQSAPGLFSVLAKSNRDHYVSQDCHDQAWHCHSYVNQEVQDAELQDQTCDQSGTSYSMVVGVLKSFPSDSGLGDSISPGLDSCPGDDCDVFQEFCEVHPDRHLNKPKTDAYANAEVLLLPVSRATNGKLLLSSLLFEPLLPSITEADQVMSRATASTPAGEKTPCLADQDSGFREHPDYARTYLPNGVPEPPKTDSDCGTNYRQNWVPGMLPDIAQKDRTCMMSANSLNEPEEVMEEPNAGFGALSLDGWMVQIQG